MVLIPLEVDGSGARGAAKVTFGLIVVNCIVFVFLQGFGRAQGFTASLWLVPAEITTGVDVSPSTPIPLWATLITSAFLHADLAHLVGNMLFLWMFGPIVEKDMGHRMFLVFYLLSCVVAGLGYVFLSFGTPVLGASGAVAGILGAMLVLQPSRKVVALLFGLIPVVLPCFFVVAVFEFINDILPLFLGGRRGVAITAHLSGLAFGFLSARFFCRSSSLTRNEARRVVDDALMSGKAVD